MAAVSTPPPAQRATLLLGYGKFGLDVLRRLLATTASRGVLLWEQPPGSTDVSERHLQDLVLLWVRDPFDTSGRQLDLESAAEGGASEVMRDLYRQIQAVGEQPEPELALAEAMVGATDRLLDAASRAGRPQPLPLGLDVIVLARPASPEVIGRLTHLLLAGVERLENYANLERAVSGAAALNFIQILDFDNYWDRSDQGRRIRTAVYNSVNHWQQRHEHGRAAFGRIYLVDGRTADGSRSESHRIEEISLFLELLLFEGQRSGELQRLYQSPGAYESPVATFGIRLLERSAGLLSRLAAAWFGMQWLDYLAGAEVPRPDRSALQVHQCLLTYCAAALDHLLGGGQLRLLVQENLTTLEQQLRQLPVDSSDWPQQVGSRYQTAARQLETALVAQVHACMQAINQELLAGLPDRLHNSIQADLHHIRQPVPLGTVIYELKAALAELTPPAAGTVTSTGTAAAALEELQQLHRRYLDFKAGQLNPERLKRWWPLFACVLSAGLLPMLTGLVQDIPAPDPASAHLLLVGAYRWLANPVAIGLLLLVIGWSVGAVVLQRSVHGRIQRARRFWDDPERGRLSGRLRAWLRPGGALNQPLERLLDRILQDMTLSIRGEVKRELSHVLDRLQERRREMRWLQGQLQKFLEMHGLRLDGPPGGSGRPVRDNTGIRYALERQEDWQRILSSIPPVPERFLSIQAERQPFASWEERYSKTFLYPLNFIDELSRQYQDPLLEDLSRSGNSSEQQARTREFRDFLNQQGGFALAFSWKAQDGVPVDRRYCLLPKTWLDLPGIRDELLLQLRIIDQNILVGPDLARAYLLGVQIGVDPACLLD